MKFEMRNPLELLVYENNARTHSTDQVDEILDSIKKYGFINPIIIDGQDCIIAGHARHAAALKLNLKVVPTLKHPHLVEALKRGYILADNQMATKAGWDYKLLKEELQYLVDHDFEMRLTGFDPTQIEEILNPEILNDGLTDGDSVPGISEAPVTCRGDVWLLGKHRLMCGDSTNPDNVDLLTNDLKPVLMVTDPPYGVAYDPEWRDQAELGVGKRSKGKVKNDDRVDWTEAYSLFTGNVAYIWHAGKFTHIVAQNIIDCGFDLVSQIIWAKQHFALSRGDYHWQHEPCWYAVRKGEKHNYNGKRDQSTLWEIKNNNSFGNSEKEETWGHGTQKPLECMLKPIENNSKPNQVIYDPFGGSGTTLIACEQVGRICVMMELDEKYCDVIVKRWEKFTGKKAILESTGEVFNG